MIYFIIRMWGAPIETDDPTAPYYVRRIECNGEVSWTTTKEFTEANYFKTLATTIRVLRGVRRVAGRVERGWLYEVIRIEEEIVASNVPEEEKEPVF